MVPGLAAGSDEAPITESGGSSAWADSSLASLRRGAGVRTSLAPASAAGWWAETCSWPWVSSWLMLLMLGRPSLWPTG